MKRLPLILLAFIAYNLFCAGEIHAQQKIGFVDVATIMKTLPEAQEAQRKLDAQVNDWQKDLDKMEKEWQTKYNDYDKRKLILTDQGRMNAEKEMQQLDQQIAQFRDKKFGQNGELFTKENELMKPIQDLVFDTVNKLALEGGYDYIFDKSGGVMILFAKDSWDLTQKVIDRLKKN